MFTLRRGNAEFQFFSLLYKVFTNVYFNCLLRFFENHRSEKIRLINLSIVIFLINLGPCTNVNVKLFSWSVFNMKSKNGKNSYIYKEILSNFNVNNKVYIILRSFLL